MLVALADTHGEADPRLTPHLRRALADATCLLHAGDFTTGEVLDAFADATDRLVAVYGNGDGPAVRDRLPAVATVEALGHRLVVVHGHDHDRTTLPLLARQEGADVVVVGHTHGPAIERMGDAVVVNPGSHAEPRGGRPGYATFLQSGGLRARLHTPEGDRVTAVDV
jgi:putative phosphoesterase